MLLIRLSIAALLVPASALFVYAIALGWNGDMSMIDSNGAGVGLMLMVVFVALVARVADSHDWVGRAAVSLGLGVAYFALTWKVWGGLVPSPDTQPHIVWLGMCLAAFSPASVIIAASTRWWDRRNTRRAVSSESKA